MHEFNTLDLKWINSFSKKQWYCVCFRCKTWDQVDLRVTVQETYLSKDTINEFPSVFLHVNECHMNMYISREAKKLYFFYLKLKTLEWKELCLSFAQVMD